VCSTESDWLIPESTEAPEAAGEYSLAAEYSRTAVLHCRMEKKSPQRNMETRMPPCDVDFLAVGFLGLTGRGEA